jgi:hypothetical protein
MSHTPVTIDSSKNSSLRGALASTLLSDAEVR